MIGANTLQEFVVARQAEFAGATGDLSRLLTDIGTAAKMVNRHVNRAELSGILGAHTSDGNGSTNVQGEAQPLAFLAHQAGGSTRCHHHDLLYRTPTSLHERTPLFTGNTEEVGRLVRSMEAAVENISS